LSLRIRLWQEFVAGKFVSLLYVSSNRGCILTVLRQKFSKTWGIKFICIKSREKAQKPAKKPDSRRENGVDTAAAVYYDFL
jgi:hypothetical protein